MDKKITLVVLAFFIINISITAVLFSTINSIQTPDITIDLKVANLTEDMITLEANLQVDNPNSFSIILEGILINTTTPEGENIGKIMLPDTTIEAGEQKTITSVSSLGFNNKELKTFHNHITGNVGITLFGFFTKTFPIHMLLITNPTLLIEAVHIPSIRFDADFSDFTDEGILFNGTIWVDNQNDFSMSLENTEIRIDHTHTTLAANFSTLGGQIPPKSTVPLYVNGTAYYSIFNQGELSATMKGNASIIVAGVTMSFPFSSNASINIPDLSTFLLNGEHLIISLSVDADITLHGLNITGGFQLYNPTNIPLTAYNLTLFLYRLDNATPTLLAKDTLDQCDIPPKNETYLTSQFLLPYRSLLPKVNTGFPERLQLSLSGDFAIANTTQRIPVTLNGCLSTEIFNFS